MLAALFLAAALALLVVHSFLSYILLGALLVYGFFPVHRRILRRLKRPAVAAGLSFTIVLVVILGPLVLLGFFVFNDAVSFARTYDPEHLNETVQPILTGLGIEPEPGENETRPSAAANWIGTKLQDVAETFVQDLQQNFAHILLGLLVTAFVLYYGFVDGALFYAQLRLAMPLPDHIEDSLFHHMRDVINAVFVGTLLVALLTSLLGIATFLAFGVPNPVFWGLLMFVAGILPLIGAFMVWLPAGIWLYLEGHTTSAILLIVINGVVGLGYIEHVLRPRLIGRMGRIHPVWVLVGVLGGLEVFGILGFIVGPLVLGIFIALMRNYIEFHPRWVVRRRMGIEPFPHRYGEHLLPVEAGEQPHTTRRGGPRKRR